MSLHMTYTLIGATDKKSAAENWTLIGLFGWMDILGGYNSCQLVRREKKNADLTGKPMFHNPFGSRVPWPRTKSLPIKTPFWCSRHFLDMKEISLITVTSRL